MSNGADQQTDLELEDITESIDLKHLLDGLEEWAVILEGEPELSRYLRELPAREADGSGKTAKPPRGPRP